MRTTTFSGFVFGSAGLLLVLFALNACSRPAAQGTATLEFLNVADGVSYVGDAQCATCHEAEFAGYQNHGMARTFDVLTIENTIEDFSGIVLHHEQTNYFYVARREGDRFVQEEYRLGPTGEKTHQLVRTMKYIIGSGSAARTYLTEIDGRLYELPLTWYPHNNNGEGGWDFSPGYDVENGRFGRAIPPRCMACHNGTSQPVDHVEGKYSSLASGIGCEQCHGPGQLHVETHQAGTVLDDSVDLTIVNPVHLSIQRRMEVCQQCHTEGSVSVLRQGESAYSYRPSRPLEDYLALFGVDSDDANTIGVTSHAERMMQSECFVVSRAMDCVTCHNPHDSFRDYGPEYFNATCIDCHAIDDLQAKVAPSTRTEHQVDSNCFSCHMPSESGRGVPHALFTDHFIRVVQEDGFSTDEGQTEELELKPYFERDLIGAEGEAYTGMAYMVYGRQNDSRSAMQRGISMLANALQELPELGEAQYLLGFTRFQLGQVNVAIPALEESIRLNPEIPERLNTLAQAYEVAGRDPSSIEELYSRALHIQPEEASIRVNLGRFLEAQGRVEEALAEYERASLDEPWLISAQYNLGTALLRLGRTADGEQSLLEAVHLDPDHSDALTNLGVSAAGRGDEGYARTLFLRAVEANPRNANALANLALASANAGDTARARQYAEEALAINPNHPTAQQVLASL